MNSKEVSLANDYAKARDLRQELRRLEESISRRAERSPVTLEDERRMTEMQARADSAYVAANRRAPPALPLERPIEYRRRLAEGLQVYSPSWRGKDLSGVTDEAAFTAIEGQIFADAVANGRTYGLEPHEIRQRVIPGSSGHTVIEYDGGPDASFIRQFAPAPRLGVFRPREEYERMSRDANLARIEQIVRHASDPAALCARDSELSSAAGASPRQPSERTPVLLAASKTAAGGGLFAFVLRAAIRHCALAACLTSGSRAPFYHNGMIAMETKNGKPLDTQLAGVEHDNERAGKIDIILQGVKVLGDMCDHLSRRVDAFEESEKEGWFRDAR